jgi:membrane-associated phospholipid phosphatase
MRTTRSAATLLACTLSLSAHAGGFDHRLGGDPGGFWRHADGVAAVALAATAGGALYLGSEDRTGRALWQGGEAFVLSYAASTLLKSAAGRERPSETDDPHRWHRGGDSFPSRHAAGTAALVTPLIMEYGREQPAVWLLAALPAYQMVSRVKTRDHWQSDVVAGAALGVAAGYLEHQRGPWSVQLLPGGVFVGYKGRM